VGDANVLRGQLVNINSTQATVALGALQITVPSGPLLGAEVPTLVDLFIRPEQLRLTDASEPCASNGTIVSQVYQGGHVDLYIECMESSRGRLLVRLSGPQATTGRPIGSRVGISVNTESAIAFTAIQDEMASR